MANQNRYGTTAEMVIQEIDDHGIKRLLAIDGKGLYLTSHKLVNKNLADVNRYGNNRMDCNTKLEEMGYDPNEIYEENKHLINAGTGQQSKTKKLNPIKASKRRG
ncbi:MAG: hypothetical protein GY737_04205 [Desulfobacteraceae bacterium]|nr:hypothetical protein [Desulfobacteraceae bacterium]